MSGMVLSAAAVSALLLPFAMFDFLNHVPVVGRDRALSSYASCSLLGFRKLCKHVRPHVGPARKAISRRAYTRRPTTTRISSEPYMQQMRQPTTLLYSDT